MFEEIYTQARDLLRSRWQAYNFTFPKNNVDAQIVLKDLAKFCRANETTFHEDPRIHGLLEGRREVWLRIQKHLNLTPEDLWELTRKE